MKTFHHMLHDDVRTVVFLPTRKDVDHVYIQFITQSRVQLLNSRIPSCVVAERRDEVMRRVAQFNEGLRTLMLVQQRMLAHGVRLNAERIVWVGDVPDKGTDMYAVYAQSMMRGLPAPDTEYLQYTNEQLIEYLAQ